MNLDEQGGVIKKVLKIIFVGEVGSGKTSFIRQFVSGVFSEYYKSTIGVDFAHKIINWDDNTIIDLQLWDVSGEGRFSTQTRIFYQDSVAALIFFDIHNLPSLNSVGLWKKEINESVTTKSKEMLPCLLIGNKCDLVKSFEWGKTKEEMDEICKENHYVGFFETSARNRVNIDKSIDFIIKYIINHNIEPDIIDDSNTVSLSNEQHEKKSSGC